MKVTMTGRKCSLRPSFVERTETKLSKLDKFFESDAKADVTVTSERNLMRVEITIRYNGMVFRAEEAAEDPGEAVDRLMDVAAGGAEEYEDEFHVVKSKSFPVKPLDVEEAILQMNLIGHQFYMFRNGETGEINVVYRRRDGHYGLLEPDAE